VHDDGGVLDQTTDRGSVVLIRARESNSRIIPTRPPNRSTTDYDQLRRRGGEQVVDHEPSEVPVSPEHDDRTAVHACFVSHAAAAGKRRLGIASRPATIRGMASPTRTFELTYPSEPGRIVRGRVVLPRDALEPPAVLVLHGFKGFQDWGFFPLLCTRLAEAGLAAISFNVSGSGIGPDGETFVDDEGFARNTYSRELEDIARVRAHLSSGALGRFDETRIGLFGHSRGGGVGLLHAAKDGRYRAITTWAAIPRADVWTEDDRALWRQQGFVTVHNARTGRDHRIDLDLLEDFERNAERLDIARACARITAPTLLVHGDADIAVPFAALEHLASAFPPSTARTLAIAGSNHTFGATHPLRDTPAMLDRVLAATVAHFEHALRA